MTNEKIVARVIAAAGGVRPLGRKLGIKYQSVQNWRKIPPERVIAIEQVIGIPREELRPDLYLPPRPKRRQHA